MYGIGRAEAARFERHSRCFERHSKVLRATQQKGARAVSVTRLKFPHFHPYGSGARPDLSFTPAHPWEASPSALAHADIIFEHRAAASSQVPSEVDRSVPTVPRGGARA